MADHAVAHYKNDQGVAKIRIGVREFKCMGASSPFDHPHIFLDMGDDDEIVCPYCSTLFSHETEFSSDQTDPPGCLADPAA